MTDNQHVKDNYPNCQNTMHRFQKSTLLPYSSDIALLSGAFIQKIWLEITVYVTCTTPAAPQVEKCTRTSAEV